MHRPPAIPRRLLAGLTAGLLVAAGLVASPTYAGLRPDQIGTFFADASFGVPPTQVERDYSPRAGVRIVRDKATGVPHVTGTTRGGTMFGAGYAGAEDRLFTMDLLRHVGRGTLTPFADGARSPTPVAPRRSSSPT